jgi:transketolase
MRKQFCDAMITRSVMPNVAFLSGDLGFMALEPLQHVMGARFINAGIAEQNMLSVAAAMTKIGMEIWVYSIAPFCYARPFEQIRNDIALHSLPVKIVGNGGGYGYGVMGPTHHAIDDYGVMLTLQDMRVCVPAFDEDVEDAVRWTGENAKPVYLRLGRGEAPIGFKVPLFEAWRQLVHGKGPVILAVGPLAGTYISELEALPEQSRPNLWVVSILPINYSPPPEAFLFQLKNSDRLIVAEEHVAHGSVASDLILYLASKSAMPRRFDHLCARAHRFERYGSQQYLRKQSSLDSDALLKCLQST